jgi:hypothetical protein
MPPTTDTPDDVLHDKDFLELQPHEQKSYLSSVDPDFKALSPAEQDAYHTSVVLPAVRQHSNTLNQPGGKYDKIQQAMPTTPDSYGFTAGNIAKNAWQGVKDVGGFAKDLATDISNPKKPLFFGGAESGPEESTFHKYLIAPSERESEKAQQGGQGVIGSVGHSVAAAIPGVGPWVAGLAEQAGTGDVGGAAGKAAGQIVAGKLGEHVGGGAAGAVADAIPKVAKVAGEVAGSRSLTPIRDLTRPSIAPGLSKEATANLQTGGDVRAAADKIFRGVNPASGNTNLRENLSIALPDLKAIEEAKPLEKSGSKGGVINPDFRIRQTVDNIRGRLDDIWQKERQPQIDAHGDTHTISRDQLLSGLDDGEKGQIEKKLDTKIPENLSLKDADGLLKKVNARLRRAEGMNPEDRALALELSPVLDKLNDIKAKLHGSIGSTLENAGEPGIKEFNRRYGALSSVMDSMRDRMNPAEANRLIDGIRVYGGLKGPGVLERLHIKASPGRNVQKGLEGLAKSKLQTPQPTPPRTGVNAPAVTSAQRQLPPPTPVLAPNVDTSGPIRGAEPPRVVSPQEIDRLARETPRRPGQVNPANRVEPIGSVSGTSPGSRGQAGTRVAGLLPESIPKVSSVPPNAAGAVEATGTLPEQPQAVGARGAAGTRFGPRGLLRGPVWGEPIPKVGTPPPAGFPARMGLWEGYPNPNRAGPSFENVPRNPVTVAPPERVSRETLQPLSEPPSPTPAPMPGVSRPGTEGGAGSQAQVQGVPAGPAGIKQLRPLDYPPRPTGQAVRPTNAPPPGSLAESFDNPRAVGPTPLQPLKGGINAKGFEESMRTSNPRDVVDSLEAENADLRKRAEGADEEGRATVNERIRQNDERIAELKGRKGGKEPAAPGYKIEESMGIKSAVDPNGVRIYLKGGETPEQIQALMDDQIRRRAEMHQNLFGPKEQDITQEIPEGSSLPAQRAARERAERIRSARE